MLQYENHTLMLWVFFSFSIGTQKPVHEKLKVMDGNFLLFPIPMLTR